MTVVDSSVVVDLLVERLELDAIGAGVLNAPHLIENEVLNALRGLWLGKNIADDEADGLFEAFDELVIEQHPAEVLRNRVWELRHNLTAYDATYVALAEHLGTTLITRDARIAAAPGIRCPVKVL